MLNIIFFGAPGSGKGTQSLLLSKKFHFIHICAGDILRKLSESNTFEGDVIKFIINKGNLVSNDIINKIMHNHIKKTYDIKKYIKGFIYDGYPRTLIQAEYLDIILNNMKLGSVNLAFFLSININDSIKRVLNRNARIDDHNINVVKNRIYKYNINVRDLLDFYDKKQCLYKIHASKPILEVHEEIKHIVIKECIN